MELSRLHKDECYFRSISAELKPKRDRLAQLLIDAGLKPVIPEGGYFMLADISKIAPNFHSDSNECKDSKFVKYLIKEKVTLYINFLSYYILKFNFSNKGLATIPNTAFYSDQHKNVGENFIRFCFFKVRFFLDEFKLI